MQKLIKIDILKKYKRKIEAKSRDEKIEFLEVKNTKIKIKNSMISTSRKTEKVYKPSC